ncbi:MAG: hypothetical protein U9P37_00465 [Pseudomonadota bacterium]|nr:hypothetical protein [Pseudomonadota bacterium]
MGFKGRTQQERNFIMNSLMKTIKKARWERLNDDIGDEITENDSRIFLGVNHSAKTSNILS